MVTSKRLPGGAVMIKPGRSLGGASLITVLCLLLAGCIALAGVGLFAPARLAVAHEHALGLLHGGIATSTEQTFVDGCVPVAGVDAPQAITRTRRVVLYRDGTALEVIFSGHPAPTNACP